MKKIVYVIIGLIILATVTVFSIGPINLAIRYFKPDHSFEHEQRVPAPDYSQEVNWSALPTTDDLADLRPEGVQEDNLLADIDVFFIHPTGYLRGKYWNSKMDPNTATEENTLWMMANQASAFSDCRVYAPRYREATIYSFFNQEGIDEKSALDLAYEDVEDAFDYFISNYNQGRPFIIASHSQGSFHALPLIKKKIDQTPLADKMIAAYIIGMGTITDEEVATLDNIKVCENRDQTQCLIHWATFMEGSPRPEGWSKTMVCVNPLSWKRDNDRVHKDLHQGYVPSTGVYNLDFYGEDKLENVAFKPLGTPEPAHTYAMCYEGRLLVAKQKHPSMVMGEGNYHGLDFQLFHMNIRKNISNRVRKYLDNHTPLKEEVTVL